MFDCSIVNIFFFFLAYFQVAFALPAINF